MGIAFRLGRVPRSLLSFVARLRGLLDVPEHVGWPEGGLLQRPGLPRALRDHTAESWLLVHCGLRARLSGAAGQASGRGNLPTKHVVRVPGERGVTSHTLAWRGSSVNSR